MKLVCISPHNYYQRYDGSKPLELVQSLATLTVEEVEEFRMNGLTNFSVSAD